MINSAIFLGWKNIHGTRFDQGLLATCLSLHKAGYETLVSSAGSFDGG